MGDIMKCKRCGASLPSVGYLCTNCGFMMDAEQIKIQKEQMKLNSVSNKEQMVGVRFGKKIQLFQKREEISKNYKVFFFFLVFFFLLGISLFFFVYYH